MNTLTDKIWRVLNKAPLFWIIVVAWFQTWFTIGARSLWFSDEIRHGNAYEHLAGAGKWIVLYLNGAPYPDKPPLYFWLVWVLDKITTFDHPEVFFLTAMVTGMTYLAAGYWLVKTACDEKDVPLAAGLVLLTNLFFIFITHYCRMDLMFATLIIAAQVLFYKAWTDESPKKNMIRAFALCGLATLTKGPFGLAFPLVTSVSFLAWKGELKRLWNRDALKGALIMCAMLLAWALAALAVEGDSFLKNIFHDQVYKRAVSSWHHKEPVFYYMIALPLAWLPWTFTLAGLNLSRLFRRDFWTALLSTRKQAAGPAYVWIMFLSGFTLLTVVSIKVLIYMLPLLAPMAILTARGYLAMERTARARIWTATAALYGLVALAAPFANLISPFDIEIKGLAFTSLILASLAAALYALRNRKRAPVLALVLGMILWIQPVFQSTMPSLDPLMSPKAQATEMKQYIAQGYYPLAFKIYSGVYTYYAGQNILEAKTWEELDRAVAEHPDIVLGIRKKHWKKWKSRPKDMVVVHEQQLVDQPYVLAVRTKADKHTP